MRPPRKVRDAEVEEVRCGIGGGRERKREKESESERECVYVAAGKASAY